MDKIFDAIVRSDKPEQEKNEFIRRIVGVGKKRQTVDLTLNMFESTTQLLLTGSSGFQWDAAKQVYQTWGSNNKAVLRQYFTTDLMHYLLDEHFPNHFNAVWIIHTSMAELRESIDYYNQLCDILQQKATTFIRTHPAFSTVVPFCKLLREFREGIPRGLMTPLFCNTVIDVVSTYTIQTCGCEVVQFLGDMSSVIGDLLGHIWGKCNEETMWRSLKHIFELIRQGDEDKSPSRALAAVVQYFPTHSIEQALRSLLQDPSVCSGDLRIALERMIMWLQWPGAKNIHLWVNGFLQELAHAKKYSVLIQVTEGTIEKVFGLCKYLKIRDNSLAVLTVMLMGYKHSPLAFHKIADGVPSLVENLKQENSPEALSFLKQLNMLVHCMMHLHPGFPEIYEPILASVKDVESPSLHTIEERLRDRGWVTASASTRTVASTSMHPSHEQQQNGKRGLVNLGNTCYMNSIVQALFTCDSFREAVLVARVGAPERVKAKLQRAFAFLLISKRPFIEPRELLSIVPEWFEAGQQQDCSEFLKHLLDQMHEQEKRAVSHDASHVSLIQQFFAGKIENTYTCLKCGQRSVRQESFYDLPLAFPKSPKSPVAKLSNKKESVPGLLDHYMQAETLTGDNRYRCDKCNKLQDARRSLAVVHAPQLLALTLMRFSYDTTGKHGRATKICADVHYPEEIALPVTDPATTDNTSGHNNSGSHNSGAHNSGSHNSGGNNSPNHGHHGPPKNARLERYVLVGVVVHSGPSLDGGHYYTYARSSTEATKAALMPLSSSSSASSSPMSSRGAQAPAQSPWYHFNDHLVSTSTYQKLSARQKIFTRDTPYVLLYHKVTGDGGKAGNGSHQYGALTAAANDGTIRIHEDLHQLVERDNARYDQEVDQARRERVMAESVRPWPWGNDRDDHPPPPPGAGLGGPRLVF